MDQEPARLRGRALLGAPRPSGAIADALLTFAAFCAISSAGYLFNDLRDREHDRRHHEKRLRPIASGAVSPGTAAAAPPCCWPARRSALGFAVDSEVAGLVALYGVITAAYSLGLKRLVIIDVMTIASLFILRVVAGAVAVGAQASEFLLICTGDAGALPRLHQAPPGGDAREQEGDWRARPDPCSSTTRSRSSTR